MLIHHVERYVAFRQKLGVKFKTSEAVLTRFAHYADKYGDIHVTTDRIQEWCSQACSPDRARETYNMLSRFSAFLRAEDPRHAAPPIGAFGARRRPRPAPHLLEPEQRSEEHTSELQSLLRISYAVFCLQKKQTQIR